MRGRVTQQWNHRLRIRLLIAVCLLILLNALFFAHTQAHQLGTGDLMSDVPSVNEHEVADTTLRNSACGAAAATLMLDYYLPQSGPTHAAVSINKVIKDVTVTKYGTNWYQLRDGLAKASTDSALGINVPLTNTWMTSDKAHWFPALQDELDAHRPVVVFLNDGGLLDHYGHYGHFIVVSGYTVNDAIIIHDPWDSTPNQPSKIVDNATFESVWGATWASNTTPFEYMQVMPTGHVVATNTPAVPVQQTGTVTEFALSTQYSQPEAISSGSDGNLWFTQSRGGTVESNPSGGCSCVGSVGRITPSGSVSIFSDPNLQNSGDSIWTPEGITPGPDGSLRFVLTDTQAGLLLYTGTITSSGAFSEQPAYTANGNKQYTGVASVANGPDGNLWFTYQDGVGRVNQSGEITAFPLAVLDATVQMGGITTGPDGNLWFTDSVGVGRITPSGTMSLYSLDESVAAAAGIIRGPDGNLWFAEQNGIGRITPDGTITSFPLTQPNSAPDSIISGPDGNLWFTEAYGIGRITSSGAITVFPVSSTFTTTSQGQFLDAAHEGITTGPDGNLWFIDPAANKIGKIIP